MACSWCFCSGASPTRCSRFFAEARARSEGVTKRLERTREKPEARARERRTVHGRTDLQEGRRSLREPDAFPPGLNGGARQRRTPRRAAASAFRSGLATVQPEQAGEHGQQPGDATTLGEPPESAAWSRRPGMLRSCLATQEEPLALMLDLSDGERIPPHRCTHGRDSLGRGQIVSHGGPL